MMVSPHPRRYGQAYTLGYAPDAVVACRHRGDLRSMLRQWRKYGRGRARLVARYQTLGLLPQETWRDAVATPAWLAVHSVDCLRGQARRACYLRVLAHVAGQVQGSREVGDLHIRREDSQRPAERNVEDAIATDGARAFLLVTRQDGPPSMSFRRTGPRPPAPSHFLPNASARIVILATARCRGAGQRAAPLVSGGLGGWLGSRKLRIRTGVSPGIRRSEPRNPSC
jgi:hypothetical protein